jgi:hypothetical protein
VLEIPILHISYESNFQRIFRAEGKVRPLGWAYHASGGSILKISFEYTSHEFAGEFFKRG